MSDGPLIPVFTGPPVPSPDSIEVYPIVGVQIFFRGSTVVGLPRPDGSRPPTRTSDRRPLRDPSRPPLVRKSSIPENTGRPESLRSHRRLPSHPDPFWTGDLRSQDHTGAPVLHRSSSHRRFLPVPMGSRSGSLHGSEHLSVRPRGPDNLLGPEELIADRGPRERMNSVDPRVRSDSSVVPESSSVSS